MCSPPNAVPLKQTTNRGQAAEHRVSPRIYISRGDRRRDPKICRPKLPTPAHIQITVVRILSAFAICARSKSQKCFLTSAGHTTSLTSVMFLSTRMTQPSGFCRHYDLTVTPICKQSVPVRGFSRSSSTFVRSCEHRSGRLDFS